MRSSLAIDELAAHHALTTLPEVWVDLVHGRVSADEAAAAAAGREPEELVERSRALFMAPSAEDEERRLAALLAAHFAEPSRRARPWRIYGGTLALVAASLLVWILARPAAFDGGYALELSSGYLDERDQPGVAQGVKRYREDQRIALVLRPRDTVASTVGVVVFAVADGRSSTLAIEPQVNEHGVVAIAGTPAALGLSAGRWRLVAVVGPPDHLPRALEDVRHDADAPYDVGTEEVEIVTAVDPPSP